MCSFSRKRSSWPFPDLRLFPIVRVGFTTRVSRSIGRWSHKIIIRKHDRTAYNDGHVLHQSGRKDVALLSLSLSLSLSSL